MKKHYDTSRNTQRLLIPLAIPLSLAISLASSSLMAETKTQLEEVVVTAQKREQNMQDVPIAVSAFTAAELRSGAFNNIGDISQQVPSLSVNTHFAFANPKIYLRGVGNNEYQANAVGAVAVYQDDVYLAAASGQLFQFYDLEAVEVLRGPQGTLYGKNTTGGAISVRSKRPNGELSGDVNVSLGNYDALDIEGGISFPIIEDKLSARVSFVSNRRDGYVKNIFVDEAAIGRNNEDVNDRGSSAGRVILAYTPTEDLAIDVNYHSGQNNSSSMQGEAFALVDTDGDGVFDSANGFADPNENPDPFIQSYNLDTSESLKASGASVKVTYDFDELTLVSLSATEKVARNSREDVDQQPISLLEIEWDNSSKQFSQEFQLSNNGDSSLNWILGLYYFDDEIQVNNIYDIARVLAPNNLVATQDYVQDTKSLGVYGQSTYSMSEDLSLTLGIRYTDETREWSGVSSLVNIGLDTIPQQTREASWSNVSWRAALDYRIDDDKLVYFSVNRGYKAGGFNGGAVSNEVELNPYDQEELTAYEVGFKSDLLENRVRLNLTAFYYDYKDIQIFTLEPPLVAAIPVPAQLIRNGESAEIYGLEMELKALVTDKLQITLNAAYLETEIGAFVTPVGDFEGNAIGNSPKYDISAAVDYFVDVGHGEVQFHIDVTATDDRYFDPSNTDRMKQEAYELWNGRITYTPESKNWNVSLWSKNLSDKIYYAEIIPIDGFGYDERFVGEPRTYGMKFAYNF